MARDRSNAAPNGYGDKIIAVAGCDLRVVDEHWAWAESNRDAIKAHWLDASRHQPKFFNGTVHVALQQKIVKDHFLGQLVRTDFASALYWRRQNYPDVSIWDVFGSAVIRASCGAILLGRQSGGNLNAGLAYPPGGFIDEHDVCDDETIDLTASIEREISEETGIDPRSLQRKPGFLISTQGQLISINKVYRSKLGVPELRDSVLAHMAKEAEPELDEVIMVKDASEIEAVAMPDYARQLVRYLLA